MNSLFPEENKFPPGFSYEDNFISPEEEQFLLDAIRRVELHPMIFQGFEAKRKVASFGYDYSFDNRKLSEGKQIPPEFRSLIKKVALRTGHNASDFTELLITEYTPDAVINWHRDAPPFDLIAGISLLSNCKFRLKPYKPLVSKRSDLLTFEVKRRSLYIMSGASREEWMHSIAPVKQTRFSITLRTLRK